MEREREREQSHSNINETKRRKLELLFHFCTVIKPTYNCKFIVQWYQNNVVMFSRPLREKCLHSELV